MEPDTIRQHIADWVAQMGATVSQVNLAELQAMGVKISTTPAWRNRFAMAEDGRLEKETVMGVFERRVFSSGSVEGYIRLTNEQQNGPE